MNFCKSNSAPFPRRHPCSYLCCSIQGAYCTYEVKHAENSLSSRAAVVFQPREVLQLFYCPELLESAFVLVSSKAQVRPPNQLT